ncbi:MAG: murein hydrolase activator EnvC family protein [Longimicrobiaceae bacterium]
MLRAALSALLLAVALPLPVPAQEELLESRRRLQEIRHERSELRTQMTGIRSRVHDLSGELGNLGRQVTASSAVLEELDFQLGHAEEQVEATTLELLVTEDRLAEVEAVLHRRLRDIYQRGPLHPVQVLLGAETFSDLLNRYKYLQLAARQDRALMERVRELRTALTLRERRLNRELGRTRSLRTERMREHAQLETVQQTQAQTLSSLRSEERSTSQRLVQLERDEERLGSLIETLERRRREAERSEPSGAGGAVSPERPAITTRSLGSLGWPVEGEVIYRFGRESSEGVTVRWNGVGIAAPLGTPVRSVALGVVALAAPFEGYGPTVILDHGGGYYSLYLYLQNVLVREGDRVSRGQPVGTVGGRGPPEGPHVEFQIRGPGGRAMDPLEWLRGRSE